MFEKNDVIGNTPMIKIKYEYKGKEKNIFVRYFNKPLIDNYLRITIGTDEQMEKLYSALEEITGQAD